MSLGVHVSLSQHPPSRPGIPVNTVGEEAREVERSLPFLEKASQNYIMVFNTLKYNVAI